MDSNKMSHPISTQNKTKKWRVIRRYTSKFSCIEAVERLIEIHSNIKGN